MRWQPMPGSSASLPVRCLILMRALGTARKRSLVKMPETRKNQHETVVPFRTEDGIDCNLIRVRSAAGDAPKGPVLLVHGAGVRAEIFRAPVETTVVDY